VDEEPEFSGLVDPSRPDLLVPVVSNMAQMEGARGLAFDRGSGYAGEKAF
jgi:hypothetical protein